MCKDERRRGEKNLREKRKGGEVEGREMEKKREGRDEGRRQQRKQRKDKKKMRQDN